MKHTQRTALPIALPLLFAPTACDDNPSDPRDKPRISSDASGFFDDFSADSLRLTVDREYTIEAGRIVITAAATSAEEQGEAELDPWGRSNSITAGVSLSRKSRLSTDEEANASVRISGNIYNNLQDDMTDDRARCRASGGESVAE